MKTERQTVPMPPVCAICATLSGPGRVAPVYEDDLWHVRPAPSPPGVPGWMMMIARRHVPGPAHFDDAEARAFGLALRHFERVLEEVTGALRVYTAAMGESSPSSQTTTPSAPMNASLRTATPFMKRAQACRSSTSYVAKYCTSPSVRDRIWSTGVAASGWCLSPGSGRRVLAAILAAAPACKRTEPAGPPPAATTPDEPQGFGPRLVWLAFRASPEAVARALDIRDVGSSTWAEGLKAAYQGRVFVTPPIAAAGGGAGAPASAWQPRGSLAA